MQNLNILCLEDDGDLVAVLRHFMEDEGHTLVQATSGAEGLDKLATGAFDVILMDLGLLDGDSLGLIPRIKQTFLGPLIILSGKTDTTNRIVGLEMGADDYMTKPFEMRELLARIRANMRRGHGPAETAVPPEKKEQADTHSAVYHFHGFIYDCSKMRLSDSDGVIINITSGECALLMLFLVSNGRVLTREYLFEQTRGDQLESYDRAVDIQVTRLRKKLKDDPADPKIIKTVRGVGYMFVADVQTKAA